MGEPWEDPDFWNQPTGRPESEGVVKDSGGEPSEVSGGVDAGVGDADEIQSRVRAAMLLEQRRQQELWGKTRERLVELEREFVKNAELVPWKRVAEQHFAASVRSGLGIESAYNLAVEHVQQLRNMGMEPPAVSSSNPFPSPNRGVGVDGGLDPGLLRPDERGMGSGVGFYSEERREGDRDKWMRARKKDLMYRKSGGLRGEPLLKSYPDAMK